MEPDDVNLYIFALDVGKQDSSNTCTTVSSVMLSRSSFGKDSTGRVLGTVSLIIALNSSGVFKIIFFIIGFFH